MSVGNELPVLFLYTPDCNYVRPYFTRLINDFDISDSIENALHAVMISSVDIYDVEQGLNFNELTELREDSVAYCNEAKFIDNCRRHGIHWTVLRCANIVCTGMQGLPRRMAEKIYGGTYVGLANNNAVCSLVHAVDLPSAALATLDSDEIFNVTDGLETKVNDLADALAWRIAQKRIFFISQKWYRFLFGKKNFNQITRSLTFSSEKIKSKSDFKPHSTVEYLKTHDYNNESL